MLNRLLVFLVCVLVQIICHNMLYHILFAFCHHNICAIFLDCIIPSQFVSYEIFLPKHYDSYY